MSFMSACFGQTDFFDRDVDFLSVDNSLSANV